MNRGFRFYFAQAMRASCASLWKKGNILKYLAYFIMSFLARLTVIFGAMFSLANVSQAKIAAREKTVDVPQSFRVACRAKPFFTMLLTILLEALIFIAGLILIAVGSALLGAVGFVISLFVDALPPLMLILIFTAPGMIVAVVYTVIMFFMYAPTAYIIETNPDIGAANAISVCFNTMKSRGKGTYFVTLFVTFLIEAVILALGVGIEFVILIFVNDPVLSVVLLTVVALLFFVCFALVAPMFALARKITVTALFGDIVLDPVNASKHTNGINIRRCKGVKFDPALYENELTALFDETYSDRIPAPFPAVGKKLAVRTAPPLNPAPVQPVPAQPVPAQPAPEQPAPVQPAAEPVKPAVPAEAPVSEPPVNPAPAGQKEFAEPPVEAYPSEEEGELLTVSDLIRDVEEPEIKLPSEEPPAELPAEPVKPADAVEPAAPDFTEPVEPAEPDFTATAESEKTETAESAETEVGNSVDAETAKPVTEPQDGEDDGTNE